MAAVGDSDHGGDSKLDSWSVCEVVGCACTEEWECHAPLVCNGALFSPNSLIPGACASPGYLFSPCAESEDCGYGLACQLGPGEPQCKVAVGVIPDCIPACDYRQVCNRTYYPPKCSDPVSEGGACWKHECESGLICNRLPSPNECRPPGKVGSGCVVDGDCEFPLYCTSELFPTCLIPKSEGQTCERDKECATGYCILEICGFPQPED